MARVGTPVDGAMEERAECGEGSGIGRMVQRGQGVLAGMASGMVMDGNGDGAKSETPSLWNFLILFYYEGPLPNLGEEVVLPWGVPPYIMWVGGEYKSFSLILVEIVQRVQTPARVAGCGRGPKTRVEIQM